MADIPLNVVIYMAFKPLIKVYLSAGLGFVSVKQGILTTEGTAVISQMILNFFLPCLVFANVVGNIKTSDAESFGILVFTCAIYFALGAVFAGILRLTTPIPKAWIGGLTYASILNNSGDLPIAYVQTLGKSSYFPDNSTSVGTAYCVLYNLGFNLFVFNFGGAKILSWDADVPGPNKFEPTVPPFSFTKLWLHFKGKKDTKEEASSDLPTVIEPERTRQSHEYPVGLFNSRENDDEDRAVSLVSGSVFTTEARSIDDIRITTEVATVRHRSRSFGAQSAYDAKLELEKAGKQQHLNAWQKFVGFWRRAGTKFKEMNPVTSFIANFIINLFRIQALSVMVAILVAFVPWLRRLFVADDSVHGIHDAPDGRPPLDFIMDFASFMGQCQVQLGLFLLGGNIARLKVKALPKGFWKSMVGLAIFKLCLLPIFAAFWTSQVRKLGWYDETMPMFPVVMTACSATPSATSQIYLTLMYTIDPDDAMQQLNCLGATIIANYALLPVTMTVVMSYTVKNLL